MVSMQQSPILWLWLYTQWVRAIFLSACSTQHNFTDSLKQDCDSVPYPGPHPSHFVSSVPSVPTHHREPFFCSYSLGPDSPHFGAHAPPSISPVRIRWWDIRLSPPFGADAPCSTSHSLQWRSTTPDLRPIRTPKPLFRLLPPPLLPASWTRCCLLPLGVDDAPK